MVLGLATLATEEIIHLRSIALDRFDVGRHKARVVAKLTELQPRHTTTSGLLGVCAVDEFDEAALLHPGFIKGRVHLRNGSLVFYYDCKELQVHFPLLCSSLRSLLRH